MTWISIHWNYSKKLVMDYSGTLLLVNHIMDSCFVFEVDATVYECIGGMMTGYGNALQIKSPPRTEKLEQGISALQQKLAEPDF